MNLILAWKIVETQVQYNISALVHKLDKREKDAFGKECIKKILVKKKKKVGEQKSYGELLSYFSI